MNSFFLLRLNLLVAYRLSHLPCTAIQPCRLNIVELEDDPFKTLSGFFGNR